jgi:hypothetical protein
MQVRLNTAVSPLRSTSRLAAALSVLLPVGVMAMAGACSNADPVGGSPEAGAAIPTGTATPTSSTPLPGVPDAQVADVQVPSEAGVSGVETYATTVAGSQDPADIYFVRGSTPLPVVVLAQGAKVDKANYSNVARKVASYGFIVIVPNHRRMLIADTNFYPEGNSVLAAFAHVVAESKGASAPIRGLADATKLALLGHSFGGALGIGLLGGSCNFPFCPFGYTYSLPPELKAGVFFGASVKPPVGAIPATANAGRGIALIQGSLDSKNAEADARGTYDKIESPPRAFVQLTGSNHYGITNSNNPAGADADSASPTLAQATANDEVGRWAGVFLRATVLADAAAKADLQAGGTPGTVVTAVF